MMLCVRSNTICMNTGASLPDRFLEFTASMNESKFSISGYIFAFIKAETNHGLQRGCPFFCETLPIFF